VVDIRQGTGTTRTVIKPKFVKEALQWNPTGERKCKVTSVKPN